MAEPKFTMAQLEALEAQGYTKAQAARALGCHCGAVADRIRRRVDNGGPDWQGAVGKPGRQGTVDMAEVERLEAEGLTMSEAADALGVVRGSLWYHIACRVQAGGPEWRGAKGATGGRPRAAEAEPYPALRAVACDQPPAPETPQPVLCPALVATGGRYADLRAYACARGITFTEAQRRWHGLRLPLQARGR